VGIALQDGTFGIITYPLIGMKKNLMLSL